MKFRFEQKVIYRDLDPFVIISLWVFAVSLQFSYAIKWDHNICHGGRRGRRKRLQRRGRLKEVWCTKEKHIHNFLHPSIHTTKYFNDYRTLAFMECVGQTGKLYLFAFGLLSLISTNIKQTNMTSHWKVISEPVGRVREALFNSDKVIGLTN